MHKARICISFAELPPFISLKIAPGSVRLAPRLALLQINGGLEASPPLGE
jgi:hypothetical protein